MGEAVLIFTGLICLTLLISAVLAYDRKKNYARLLKEEVVVKEASSEVEAKEVQELSASTNVVDAVSETEPEYEFQVLKPEEEEAYRRLMAEAGEIPGRKPPRRICWRRRVVVPRPKEYPKEKKSYRSMPDLTIVQSQKPKLSELPCDLILEPLD